MHQFSFFEQKSKILDPMCETAVWYTLLKSCKKHIILYPSDWLDRRFLLHTYCILLSVNGGSSINAFSTQCGEIIFVGESLFYKYAFSQDKNIIKIVTH